MTPNKRLNTMFPTQKGKPCCLLAIFLTQTAIRSMTTGSGTHGAALLRRAQLISLGFGEFQEENEPFKPYLHRYHVPHKASESTSPLWYAIKRASAHIIVLSSYSAYGKQNLIFIRLRCLSTVHSLRTYSLSFSCA